MKHQPATPGIDRSVLCLVSLLFLALAASGCTSHQVRLPADPVNWNAYPVDCVSTNDGPEVVITPGRVVAEDFVWDNSEIEFDLFDPGSAGSRIAFYDDNFAKIRRKHARNWFEQVPDQRLSEPGRFWKISRVHSLEFGGDKTLLDEGYRVVVGSITTEIGPQGMPEKEWLVVFGENFKINDWNHIRIRIQEGTITVWINGEEGPSVQADGRLGGAFGFEVRSGRLRLTGIRLRQPHKGSEPFNSKPEDTQSSTPKKSPPSSGL